MNNVFLFPGQGAQYVGMGKDFYEAFSAFRETFEEASDLLSFDFKRLILEGPESELILTKNSQPAIFLTSVAILRCLDIKPSICAGLSLGEYTALYASGRVSFADCLKIVAARGRAMQEACQEKEGTMRVVLGLEPVAIEAYLPKDVWIANLNCPGQVVIAGSAEAMSQLEEILKEKGAKRVLPLGVSGAFHTPMMESAKRKLEKHLKEVSLQESDIRLMMNVPGDFVESLSDIRKYLIAQVVSPTQWEKGIRKIDQENSLFIEIGPGKTLAGMNRKIGTQGSTISIEKVEELEKAYATTQR